MAATSPQQRYREPHIVTLQDRHAAFYAPSYRVLVDDENILLTRHMEVASVSLDFTLEGAARFAFTINNTFDLEQRQFRHSDDKQMDLFRYFELGKRVRVWMGYEGSRDRKDDLFIGMITSVTTAFPAAGNPAIQISGYDLSYPMTKGRNKKTWDDKKDSDIVAELARKHNLEPEVQATKPTIKKTQQDESDLALIHRLARRNGYEVYTLGKQLFFKEPSYKDDPSVVLKWREGLRSFNVAANLASTVTRVEVYGWDPKQKKEIVGVASREEPAATSGDKGGSSHLANLVGDEGVLKFRSPVYSKAQADELAKSILKRHSEGFVRGDGESIGLPEIMIDRRVALYGLGRFDKEYYVESCTHTADANGFVTRFKVKEVSI